MSFLDMNTITYTNANTTDKPITGETISEMMVSSWEQMSRIPKPKHDCFVFTKDSWTRIKEECPIMGSESFMGKFDGLPIHVERDEVTAKAVAEFLASIGKKPLMLL